MKNEATNIIVTGDLLLAHDIIHPTGLARDGVSYAPTDSASVYLQSGGAWHITNILENNFQTHPDIQIFGAKPPDLEQFKSLCRAYTIWAPYERERGSKEKSFRIKEYLGTQRDAKITSDWYAYTKTNPKPDLVVVVDENLDFAKEAPDLGLLDFLKGDSSPWILLKHLNHEKNASILHLMNNQWTAHCDRMIVLVSAQEFRRMDVRVGSHLSWESTSKQVINAVKKHPLLKTARFVIVSFAGEGAIILERDQSVAQLIFTPHSNEGSWSQQYQGMTVGSTSCVQASLAIKIGEALHQGRELHPAVLEKGVVAGILAARKLHEEGYFSPRPKNDPEDRRTEMPVDGENPASQPQVDAHNPTTFYVLESNKKILEKDERTSLYGGCLSCVELSSGQENFIVPIISNDLEKISQLAFAIVVKGLKEALPWAPVTSWGRLSVVDPQEIESLRSVHRTISTHIATKPNKPVSIVVFGQPGSGKSFTVEEVAREFYDQTGESLTFNLSQFSGPDDLIGAFHQVRDRVILGKIPLVFWDEFDTALNGKPLGWLRYFLAPMQDGSFQEGQTTHPIGGAIFVFAGGTSDSFESFKQENGLNSPNLEKEIKDSKGPDFVSRLRANLDIQGLNPKKDNNNLHLLRRAILLHHKLESYPFLRGPDGISIQHGVLNALLNIDSYRYGARSMEAIIAMADLRGSRQFTLSHLPQKDMLQMHVDADNFLALLDALQP